MKLKTTFIFCAPLLLAACTHHSPTEGKLKTFYSSQNGDTIKCDYDAEGRLTAYTGARGYKTSYEYKGNTIIETTVGGRKVEMYLNGKGLVDSLTDVDLERAKKDSLTPRFRPTRTFPYSGIPVLFGGVATDSKIILSKKFVYDSLGLLSEQRAYINGRQWVTLSYIVENGNIRSCLSKNYLTDTVTAINPKTKQKETKVIHYSDELNKMDYSHETSNSLTMEAMFGKYPKNLTSRKLTFYPPGASRDSTITSYKYTFDEKGRVATLIKTEKSTDPPEWNNDARMANTCSFTYY